jgi:hypothetical protein
MKQSAVESIIEFCKKQKNNDVNSHKGAYSTIIKFCEEQAKEMEKQQIIDARVNGVAEVIDIGAIPIGQPITEDISKNHEIYHNETFNK